MAILVEQLLPGAFSGVTGVVFEAFLHQVMARLATMSFSMRHCAGPVPHSPLPGQKAF
jgi:hypothetical protein